MVYERMSDSGSYGSAAEANTELGISSAAGVNTDEAATPALLAGIATDVSQLRDLFQRRLLDDKVKAQLINDLTCRLDGMSIKPLCREVILLLDRIEAYLGEEETRLDEPVHNLANNHASNPAHNFVDNRSDFIQSIYEELLQIFAHYGLTQIETRPVYDCATQKIVQTTIDPYTLDMMVVAVQRYGYQLNDALLRSEEVVVVKNPGIGRDVSSDFGDGLLDA
jgi:molecular chaperone GrpE